MIAATLFSGIGAPENAMPHWDWRWCAEIEKFAGAVLQQRHPHTVNLGDVSADDFTERAAQIARPDVIVFGSPCQSFSVAGQRLGLDDPRGNLALVALGIVKRLKPRWFLFENVPGLLSSAGGSDFGLFLRAVDDIGYCCSWTVLDAQHFGVAQRRERLFVVGSSGDWRGPAAVLFEPEGVRGYHPPRRAKGERIAPTVESRANAGGAGWGTDFLAGGGMAAVSKSLPARPWSSHREDSDTLIPDIAWALQERDAKGADSDTKQGHLIVSPTLRAGGNQTGGNRPPGTDVDTADSLIVADPITASFAKHHGASGGKDSLPRNHVLGTFQQNSMEGRGTLGWSDDGDAALRPIKPQPDHQFVVLPILEAGARTGKSTDDIRAGMGVGEPGDPMFTLQSGKQHAIGFQSNAGSQGHEVYEEMSPTMRAQTGGGGGMPAVAFTCKDSGQDMGVEVSPTLRSMNAADGNPHPNGGGQVAVAFMENVRGELRVSDQTDCLKAGGGKPGQGYQAVAFQTRIARNGRGQPEEIVPSLNGSDAGATSDMRPCIASASAVRRLTPVECERLQGFPDGYTQVVYRGKEAADGPRYRALGNSMAVPVVRWILERIERVNDGDDVRQAAE